MQGEDYRYQLVVRPLQSDFSVSTDAKELSIANGTGAELTITANRKDNFDEEIELSLEGLPAGVIATSPLTIQKEQYKTIATIFIPKDAANIPSEFKFKVHAKAIIHGEVASRSIDREITVKRSDKANVQTTFVKSADSLPTDEITEIVIRPGETISTFIAVERGDHQGEIAYGGDDSGRNLPHGIIVSNIGLSGLMIRTNENHREVFLTAAPWLEPQVRPFHLRSTLPGIQLRNPSYFELSNKDP